MDEAKAFAAAIREQPEESTAWLAFADWLAERDLPLEHFCRARAAAIKGSDADFLAIRLLVHNITAIVRGAVPREQVGWLLWEIDGLAPTEKVAVFVQACERSGHYLRGLAVLASAALFSTPAHIREDFSGATALLEQLSQEQSVSSDELLAEIPSILSGYDGGEELGPEVIATDFAGYLSILAKCLDDRSCWLSFGGNIESFFPEDDGDPYTFFLDLLHERIPRENPFPPLTGHLQQAA